jgi:ADP-ribose pyrophosphatase
MRELKEETGYAAETFKALLSCYMAPGYSSEVIHFFVARGLTEAAGEPEPDEEIAVERLGLEEVLGMIAENVIEDAKTIVGVLSYSNASAGS